MMPGVFAGAMGISGGGGGPTQNFSFNPSDKSPSAILSNGNKTASATVGVADFYVMCTVPKSSGKWQFEFTVDSMPPATGRVTLGMADSPATGNTLGNLSVNTGFDWIVRISAALSRWYNGGTFDTLNTATESFNTGDRVGFTVDFSTKEVKAYRNGSLILTKTVSTIDTSTHVYAPMVKVFPSTTVPAQVSIPSDILYPVAGFTPWA